MSRSTPMAGRFIRFGTLLVSIPKAERDSGSRTVKLEVLTRMVLAGLVLEKGYKLKMRKADIRFHRIIYEGERGEEVAEFRVLGPKPQKLRFSGPSGVFTATVQNG